MAAILTFLQISLDEEFFVTTGTMTVWAGMLFPVLVLSNGIVAKTLEKQKRQEHLETIYCPDSLKITNTESNSPLMLVGPDSSWSPTYSICKTAS